MEFDPHTIHQILQRIRQQMRCPQCGEKVPVELPAVRITGDDFLILQLRCEACDAYIVLHASLQGLKNLESPKAERDATKNASSTISLKEKEIESIATALEKSAGSFDKLFAKEKRTDVA